MSSPERNPGKMLAAAILAALLAAPSSARADDYSEEEDAYADDAYAETDDDSDAGGESESMADLLEAEAQDPGEGGAADIGAGGGYDDDFGGGEDAGSPEPQWFYVGGDYVWSRASFSKPALREGFGGQNLDSSFYRVRAGLRIFEHIGFELQYGMGDTSNGDLETGEYRTDQFYAAYFVPTGVLLDFIEISAPIGYARTELERGDVSEGLGGVSFGVNMEAPVYTGESFEIRIGGGGTVYRAQNSARIYGYHAGLRVDFGI